MRILVTGGAGFIGSNFVRYMLAREGDFQIVNLDKLTYAGNLANLESEESDPRYRFVRGDIAVRDTVDRVFCDVRPDAIVNFAAESHVDRSLLDASSFFETNVKGVHVLLEAAREQGVGKFVHISTDEVYGSLGEEGSFTESTPLFPNNPYAGSKAAAEMLCRAYGRSYGIPVVITRSSNNYGPFQFPEKLIPLMIRNALRGDKLPVYGEGREIRDWLHVADNCRAIATILERGCPGEVYNIGGGNERRNLQVVELICELLASRVDSRGSFADLIEFIPDPRGLAHDFRYALDCTKIREELHWEPEHSFESGLSLTVDWYLENQNWVESVISGDYQAYYQRVYGQA